MLDRCNLIRLPSRYRLDAEAPRLVAPRGPAVTHRQFAGWVKESAGLDRAHAEILDNLSEPLAKMGCSLNARRYQAIRRVLGNTPSFACTTDQALDLQITQRVLPQVRNLFRPGAREALKSLRRVLENTPGTFPESLELLEEIEGREGWTTCYGLGVMLFNGWLVQNPRIGGFNLIFAHLLSRSLSVVVVATMGPKVARYRVQHGPHQGYREGPGPRIAHLGRLSLAR